MANHALNYNVGQCPISEEHRRVHIHVQGEVFNIHKHLMDSMDECWTETWQVSYLDEKDENHYKDENTAPWVYRIIILWLYKGTFPDHDQLKDWMGTIPPDWLDGSEAQPLTCSIAIHLHLFADARNWFGLEDMMTTVLFQQYQKQRLPPSSARVRQLFEKRRESDLKNFFLDLHLKFYDPACYSGYFSVLWKEMENWPKDFLFLLFVHRARKEAESKMGLQPPSMVKENAQPPCDPTAALQLYQYHSHYTYCEDLGMLCSTCKNSELRAAFTIP